eukprot:m.135645 g.135645  ORF g.135645 m.135645 type:complete len:505 (-) comp16565_c0_seq5:487-2001(-)
MAKVFRALYAFEVDEPDELELQPGDLIDVPIVHTGDWGVGVSRRTRKQGTFPWSYVEPVRDAPPPVAAPVPAAKPKPRPQPGGSQASLSLQSQGDNEEAPPLVPRSLKPKNDSAPPPTAALPPKPTSVYNSNPPATQGAPANLERFAWFAGEMDRQMADAKLFDRADGAFLVRVSKTHRGFSLSVKFGEIRHIVILVSNGKYGFSEPCTYESLPDLIAHYQRESLSCYNAELETTLAYPYKDAPKDNPNMEGTDDGPDEDVYISNVSALRESLAKQARDHHRHERTAAAYGKRVKQFQLDLKAQEEILNFLLEQKQLHAQFSTRVKPTEAAAFADNLKLLLARLKDAEQTKQNLMRDLKREMEEEDRRLKDVPEESAPPPVVSSQRAASVGKGRPPPMVPEPKDSQYYVGVASRPEAEKMLEGLPDGTFLVRYSNKAGSQDPYTLSVRYLQTTKHIQIKHDGTLFGLADPLAFSSLDELCQYYTQNKLSQNISTPLKTPIKQVN